MDSMQNLTARERRFCSLYIPCRNAREAAIQAGYSVRASQKRGAELLQRPDIRAYVEELEQARKEQNRRGEVMDGFRRLAFGSVTDAVRLSLKGEQTEPELDKLDLFCVTSIKRGRDTVEVRFADRLAALDRLRDMLDDHALEHENARPFFEALEEGAKRLNQPGQDA